MDKLMCDMASKALLNVMGGKGFVGSNYVKKYPKCLVLNRRDYAPKAFADVLYFISTTDNYNVNTDPYLDIETNLTTLVRTLDNWKNNYPYGVFNFISSWFVYGNVLLPAIEDGPTDPKGFYSITKRAAEQLLISYCETFQLQYRILRLPNVLGPEDAKVSKKKNALQFLIREMMLNNPISLYDGGYFFRDYIDVRDCADAIHIVINKGRVNEIYNICNHKESLFYNLIHYAKTATNSSSVITSMPPSSFHAKVQVKNMHMDPTKLLGLGYVQKHTIYKTIDWIIDAYKYSDEEQLVHHPS